MASHTPHPCINHSRRPGRKDIREAGGHQYASGLVVCVRVRVCVCVCVCPRPCVSVCVCVCAPTCAYAHANRRWPLLAASGPSLRASNGLGFRVATSLASCRKHSPHTYSLTQRRKYTHTHAHAHTPTHDTNHPATLARKASSPPQRGSAVCRGRMQSKGAKQ